MFLSPKYAQLWFTFGTSHDSIGEIVVAVVSQEALSSLHITGYKIPGAEVVV